MTKKVKEKVASTKLVELYVVGALERKIGVSVLAATGSMPLIWGKGMVGVLPVFTSLEEAVSYRGDKEEVGILRIHVEEYKV